MPKTESKTEVTKTMLSYGDLQREFPDFRGRPMTRAVLDRILRDNARELPEPQRVGGQRLWRIEDLEEFKRVIRRDRERTR